MSDAPTPLRRARKSELVPMSTREVRDSGLLQRVNEGVLHPLGYALAIIAPVKHERPGDLSSKLIVDVDAPNAGLAMVRSSDGTPIVYEETPDEPSSQA